MKRAACLAIPLALCVFAQASRDAYRNAYKSWRQMDPELETDVARAGAGLAERAQVVAAAAAKYEAARTAFLQQLVTNSGKALSWLDKPVPAPVPAASAEIQEAYIATNSVELGRVAAAFANDPDRGMQPLRLALDREHAALVSLGHALAERQSAAEAARYAAAAAEKARLKALEQFRQIAAKTKDTLDQTSREATAWAEYYRQLGAPPVAASNVPVAASSQVTQNVAPPATQAGNAPRPVDSGVRTAEPIPIRPLVPSITPVPLVRYTGAWTYPTVNGFYHGPQPDYVDLEVNEEDGHVQGTLSSRFKLPPGSTNDPAVLFSFSGDFKNTRTQVFNLRTNAGAKGTIELIPGPAFNLLEVNFQIEPKPGKIQQGNFLLVKQ